MLANKRPQSGTIDKVTKWASVNVGEINDL
jgi:hypothetical protein